MRSVRSGKDAMLHRAGITLRRSASAARDSGINIWCYRHRQPHRLVFAKTRGYPPQAGLSKPFKMLPRYRHEPNLLIFVFTFSTHPSPFPPIFLTDDGKVPGQNQPFAVLHI